MRRSVRTGLAAAAMPWGSWLVGQTATTASEDTCTFGRSTSGSGVSTGNANASSSNDHGQTDCPKPGQPGTPPSERSPSIPTRSRTGAAASSASSGQPAFTGSESQEV